VKVYDVNVTTKEGESTAKITDYGDFLMFGVPRDANAIKTEMSRYATGIFKTAPSDVDLYRSDLYLVDFKNPNGKTFTAKFDAVGRLVDISAPAKPRPKRRRCARRRSRATPT